MNQSSQDFPVSVTYPIRWGDMDAFQHVNNATYFTYFENARIAYFDQVGVTELMAERNIGPILGSTECRYLAPVTYPDTVTVSASVTAVREKRFTMQYQVYSESQQKIVATGSGEIIYVDYNQNQTTPIPAQVLKNIQALQA